MLYSMTAFASQTGELGSTNWVWEMRGVNARGLDIRVHMPDALSGLETAVRAALKARLHRGTVTLNLRITQTDSAQASQLDPVQLTAVLNALDKVQDRARDLGVTLAPSTAADILSQRGVMVAGSPTQNTKDLGAAVLGSLTPLIADFVAMRAAEGTAISRSVMGQLDRISVLAAQAGHMAQARKPETAAQLTRSLQRILQDVTPVNPDRIAQELALLAVKADVTEEIDRLAAHVVAARNIMADDMPAGRKLDFLSQEFNRETNTLCAKAGALPLTAIGLELKSVIDQMREQIQNVE